MGFLKEKEYSTMELIFVAKIAEILDTGNKNKVFKSFALSLYI